MVATADNVNACLSGAHLGQMGSAPVGKSLTVVVVFLFANVQGCEGDFIVGDKVDVIEAQASGGREAEVLSNDC